MIQKKMKQQIETLFRCKIPGLFLTLFFRKRSASAYIGFPRHIVFLRPGKLGDMLVATPLFHALKTELPQITITVACSPYNHVIVKNTGDADNIKVVNFHSLRSLLALLKWIRSNRVDLVVDLTPGISRTSTMLSCFLGMASIRTAGMHKGEFSRFFDINTDPQGMHIIDRNRVLLETVLPYQFKTVDFHPLIYSTEEQVAEATDFIRGVGKDEYILGINLSAGKKERQWEYENYLGLSLKILKYFGKSVKVILFSHGEQKHWAEQIARQTGFHIAPSTDILTTAEVLRFCELLFTPDTAFLHLASAVKVPVVALYCTAGENLVRWRTYGVKARELVASQTLDVNEISAQEAFNEIIDILETGKNDAGSR